MTNTNPALMCFENKKSLLEQPCEGTHKTVLEENGSSCYIYVELLNKHNVIRYHDISQFWDINNCSYIVLLQVCNMALVTITEDNNIISTNKSQYCICFHSVWDHCGNPCVNRRRKYHCDRCKKCKGFISCSPLERVLVN